MMRLALLILMLIGMSHAGDFDEPECMKMSIAFWEKVYTVYDQDDIIAHNPETFEIYQVIKKHRSLKVHRANIKRFRDSMESIDPDIRLRFQSGIKSRFSDGLKRHMKYRSIIVGELESQGLPLELQLLPHVESSYDPRARSRVGALGLWQIMPRTAWMYGGRRKNLHNVETATPIAVSILKHNYEETGSWPMALWAYNHGLAGVKKAMKSLGTDDVCIVIEQHSSKTFKFASKNFYAQFLAVKRIMDCMDKDSR